VRTLLELHRSTPAIPGRAPAWQRRWRRQRRLLAAGLAFVVVWSLGSGLHPAAAPTAEVVVATRDLQPGETVGADDLTIGSRPRAALPDDALTVGASALGRRLTTAVHSGEAVRARDIVSPRELAGLGVDLRAVPVRLADDAATALLRPGDLVDVLVASGGDGTSSASAVVVARAVRVLVAGAAAAQGGGLLSGPSSTSLDGSTSGSVLVLATTEQQALDLARAAAGGHLSVALRPA
jgi:pilus assembly protein CpaB